MIDCPNCNQEAQKLICCSHVKKLMCNLCHENHESKFNYQLHQKVNGVSNGKAWEIENRIISPDDRKTVINRVTGKPAQY